MISRRRCCCITTPTCILCVSVKVQCVSLDGVPVVPGTPVSGATVTAVPYNFTGATVTCTTDSSGQCCMGVVTGQYQVFASYPGYTGSNTLVNVVCVETASAFLIINPAGKGPTASFNVFGCKAGLPGASVSITGSGGGGGSGTTDSGGNAGPYSVGVGTLTWTVSAPRFTTQTGTCTISGTSCGDACSINVTLVAASGYVCTDSCDYPIATTLYYGGPPGNVTLTYEIGVGWVGCGTFMGSVGVPPNCITCEEGEVNFSMNWQPGEISYNSWANTTLTCWDAGVCSGGGSVTPTCSLPNNIAFVGTITTNVCPVPNFTSSGNNTGGVGLFQSVYNGEWEVTE